PLRVAAPHHPHDFDHVAVSQGAARVVVALEDLAVDLDGDRSGIDTQLSDVVEERGGSQELDRLAGHAHPDHLFSKYPIAATPEAPASAHAAALGPSTPPMASTRIPRPPAPSL